MPKLVEHQPQRAAIAAKSPRVVRIGLLGLGQVGQALVRVCTQYADAIARQSGLTPRVVAVLVRDRARPRATVPMPALITNQPAEFFAERFDILVEVMGGIEPANTYVRQALHAGIPVVTANKSLLAQHGPALHQLAAHSGTSLRVEAAAIAGVPFIGNHARRPLAARLAQLTGILNGTSNYILTRVAREGLALETALAQAQAQGYAEPDPTNDVSGIDAAEKLVVILSELGRAHLHAGAIERTGIDAVAAGDLEGARALGGTLKPVAHASLSDDRVAAFVGPAFVPADHPLASVHGAENGIVLQGPAFAKLCYTGRGAGPEITAATCLDDVLELAATESDAPRPAPALPDAPQVCDAPHTPWFVRLDFHSALPDAAHLLEFLGARGVWTQRTHAVALNGGAAWFALTYPVARDTLVAALAALRDASDCHARHYRALEN
jgi:homoserine dehydrogenase